MRKTNLIALAALIASVSAGCEYHRDGFQEVRMPAQETADVTRETEVAVTPEASSDVSPEILKGMTDLQNKIDALQRQIEAQNTIIAAHEYAAPTEPAAEETPEKTPEESGEEVPDLPPSTEPPAGETAPEQTIAISPTLKVDLVIGASGDNIFRIVFNEEVDFASVNEHHSIALYTSSGAAVPGYLTAEDPTTKIVEFVSYAPLAYKRDSNGHTIATSYTMKVFGADPDPSKAVKDKNGKAMKQDHSAKLTCVDMPAEFQITATHCE